jgi:hypothetical protein
MIRTLADQIARWLENFKGNEELPYKFTLMLSNCPENISVPHDEAVTVFYNINNPMDDLAYFDMLTLTYGISHIKLQFQSVGQTLDFDLLPLPCQQEIIAAIWMDYRSKKQ